MRARTFVATFTLGTALACGGDDLVDGAGDILRDAGDMLSDAGQILSDAGRDDASAQADGGEDQTGHSETWEVACDAKVGGTTTTPHETVTESYALVRTDTAEVMGVSALLCGKLPTPPAPGPCTNGPFADDPTITLFCSDPALVATATCSSAVAELGDGWVRVKCGTQTKRLCNPGQTGCTESTTGTTYQRARIAVHRR